MTSHAQRLGLLALAAVLAVVSTHTAMNLGGPPLVAVYYAAIAVVALLVPTAANRLPRRMLPVLVGGAVVVLVAAAVVTVPSSWNLALGVGSDRANALDVALSRLAEGQYPYTGVTYLGNPITPLPGSLLLAAPFWLLSGSSATQNLIWTLALLPVLARGRRLRGIPTVLWLVVVIGGLEVWREYLVGDDLVTSVVPVVAALAWVLRARTPQTAAVAAIALGLTTCSRPHLALVVVIAAVAVGVRSGARRGAMVGGLGALTWVALIGPFLFGGAGRFSPLHVASKVTGQRGVHLGIVVLALLAAVAVAGALWWLRPRSESTVGWCAAAVAVAPTVLSAGLWLAVSGSLWEADLTLGAGAVPLAAWAVATGHRRDDEPPEPTARRSPSITGVTGRRTVGL